MQLTRQHVQIIEKVVHTEQGVFLARFAVANIGGVLKAKLISMVSVDEPSAIQNSVFLLENPRTAQQVIYVEPSSDLIVSPYSELFFLTSISPRAPNTTK